MCKHCIPLLPLLPPIPLNSIHSVIVIIIALKGAIGDFYNLLTGPRTVSNLYAQVARAHLCANPAACATHGAFIPCNMLCATWYEGTAQLFSSNLCTCVCTSCTILYISLTSSKQSHTRTCNQGKCVHSTYEP